MLVPLLVALAQPSAGTPVDPATMSPQQRAAVNAIGAWMTCLFPRVADIDFPTAAAADSAADAALLACRNEEAAIRAAYPRGRARSAVEDLRRQFRTGVREGAIRRTSSAR